MSTGNKVESSAQCTVHTFKKDKVDRDNKVDSSIYFRQ